MPMPTFVDDRDCLMKRCRHFFYLLRLIGYNSPGGGGSRTIFFFLNIPSFSYFKRVNFFNICGVELCVANNLSFGTLSIVVVQ
jgi:hypothetical protein